MKKHGGFTLVEIMIVVAIVGLLAMLAIPSFVRARRNAQDARFIQDMRIAVDAFTMFNLEHGHYPPDTSPGVIPAGMAEYLRGMRWDQPTPIGGAWDWDFRVFGVEAGVSVFQPNRAPTEMISIAERLDNGSLVSGQFRSRADGYIYIIEF